MPPTARSRSGRRRAGEPRRSPCAPARAEDEVAPRGGHARERRGRRPGERHQRQRVAGERLAAQHHEPADQPGHHRDDVPASSALTMKWYSSSCATSCARFQVSVGCAASAGMRAVRRAGRIVAVVVMRRRLGLADDDQPAVGGAQHLDRRAVQRAQRLARDHLAAAGPRRRGRRRDRRPGRGSAASG